MLKPTPDEIERWLTDENEVSRVAFAGRYDYTPTPAQIERGLTDKNASLRMAFAIRKDYIPTPAQIERRLDDKDELVRMAFAEHNNSLHCGSSATGSRPMPGMHTWRHQHSGVPDGGNHVGVSF